MPTYRIQLELKSAIGTPLAADTLWGHICWGIRWREGEDALVDWLNRYDEGVPPLVLSDPFPAGFLPRPILPPPPPPEKCPSDDELDLAKNAKKIAWLSYQDWLALAGNLSPQSVVNHLLDLTKNLEKHKHDKNYPGNLQPPSSRSASVVHAAINRLTGGTAQEGGGTLYATDQEYYDFSGNHPPQFEVWASSSESPATVRQWFVDGLAGGYGRDGATGLGHIVIPEQAVQKEDLPTVENPNAVMLLGPCVPRPGDPYRGFFKFAVKSGRLGGDFAIGEVPGDRQIRQKRPVHHLTRGSILLTDNPPPYLGRVLKDIHPYADIRFPGISPTLPLRLADDAVSELEEAAA